MHTLILGLAIIVAAPAPKEAKKLPSPLVGDWTIESGTVMGMPQLQIQGANTIRFSADGTTATLDGNGDTLEMSKFTQDSKASPAQIDLEKASTKFAGIYKIEVDTLTICLTFEGERPVNFTASGKNIILFTMKRLKKD